MDARHIPLCSSHNTSGLETTQGHLKQHPAAAGLPTPHCASTQAVQPEMTETKERCGPSTQNRATLRAEPAKIIICLLLTLTTVFVMPVFY